MENDKREEEAAAAEKKREEKKQLDLAIIVRLLKKFNKIDTLLVHFQCWCEVKDPWSKFAKLSSHHWSSAGVFVRDLKPYMDWQQKFLGQLPVHCSCLDILAPQLDEMANKLLKMFGEIPKVYLLQNSPEEEERTAMMLFFDVGRDMSEKDLAICKTLKNCSLGHDFLWRFYFIMDKHHPLCSSFCSYEEKRL